MYYMYNLLGTTFFTELFLLLFFLLNNFIVNPCDFFFGAIMSTPCRNMLTVIVVCHKTHYAT